MENIDTIDLEILKQLQENSNINIKELASKLYLTVTPVYERIKRLERDGYIMKYVALLDKKKMNLGMIVFCNVRLKEHAKNVGSNFVKDIVALPEIIECYNLAGDYDFMLKKEMNVIMTPKERHKIDLYPLLFNSMNFSYSQQVLTFFKTHR